MKRKKEIFHATRNQLQLIEAGGEVKKKEKLDVITILCKEHNFKFKICDDTLSGVIIR